MHAEGVKRFSAPVPERVNRLRKARVISLRSRSMHFLTTRMQNREACKASRNHAAIISEETCNETKLRERQRFGVNESLVGKSSTGCFIVFVLTSDFYELVILYLIVQDFSLFVYSFACFFIRRCILLLPADDNKLSNNHLYVYYLQVLHFFKQLGHFFPPKLHVCFFIVDDSHGILWRLVPFFSF